MTESAELQSIAKGGTYPLTLQELNKLRKSISTVRKLQNKINAKKRCAESASPNISDMPSSHGSAEGKSNIILSYIDDERVLEQLLKEIILENASALKFIMSISDLQLQLIFRYRFLNGYSWVKVANEIGGGNTADGIRKQVTRYLSSPK